MSSTYRIIDDQTGEIVATTDNLYDEMKKLMTDEFVEKFVNDFFGCPEMPYLSTSYNEGYGTILRRLADTHENDFLAAWERARQDFLGSSYRAAKECIGWEGWVTYEKYKIVLVTENYSS